MNENTQTTKETVEQFAQRIRDGESGVSGNNTASAVRALTYVTRELGIKQAETNERLAMAMEVLADQQRKQSALLGVLVQSSFKDQPNAWIAVDKGEILLSDVLAKLTHDVLDELLRKK